MGNLQSSTSNSIFNETDAEKYAPYIKQYPLPFDAVLPVFTWVKVFRNKQMIKLLNQTSLFELKQTGSFKSIDNNTIEALNANHGCGFNTTLFYEKSSISQLNISSE